MHADKLTPAQQAALKYKIRHPAASNRVVAEFVGVSAGTISNWNIPELAAAAMADDTEVILESIQEGMPRAVAVLVGQLESDDDRVAQAAAKLLLEWGLGKPKTTNIDSSTVEVEALVVTGMDLSRLMPPQD